MIEYQIIIKLNIFTIYSTILMIIIIRMILNKNTNFGYRIKTIKKLQNEIIKLQNNKI